MNPLTPLKSTATFFLAIGVLLIATAGPTSANLIVNGNSRRATSLGGPPHRRRPEVTLASPPCLLPTILSVLSLVRTVPILTQSAKPLPLPRGLPTM